MKDEEEITFKSIMSADKKEFSLHIESPSELTNADLILIIEAYLSDVIRADKQKSEASSDLH